MNIRYLILIILFCISYSFFLFRLNSSRPDISGVSTSFTLAISLCGDQKIDGDEQCDLNNLNFHSCDSLGFSGGQLFCQDNCQFDTQNCIIPTPTPTPPPTNIPTSTPVPSPIPTTIPPSETTETTQNIKENIVELIKEIFTSSKLSPTPVPNSIIIPTPSPKFNLSVSQLQSFDHDQNGLLNSNEFHLALQVFSDQWHSLNQILPPQTDDSRLTPIACDYNRDGRCDVTDFSILLFYSRP